MLRNLDFTRESRPFWFYKRVPLLHGEEYVLFQLDFGFNYIIHRSLCKYNEAVRGTICPEIKMDFLQTGRADSFHKSPFCPDLFASPSAAGVAIATETTPADQTGYGINFTATSIKLAKKLNYLFLFRDTIQVKVTGQQINSSVDPMVNLPCYVDLCLVGRYYPEKTSQGGF